MNQVARPAGASVAALQALKQNLANVRAHIPAGNRDPYLRLLKDGMWVFGSEDHPVKTGTEVVVSTMSLQHGYTCWSNNDDPNAKNEQLGEEMVPLSAMPRSKDQLPDYSFPWKDQLSFDIKFLEGTHEGKQVLYKTSSEGGLTAAKGVIDAIMAKLDDGTEFFNPIIQLGTDSYRHRKWGKTYTPLLNIVGWMDMEGNEEGFDDGGAPVPAGNQLTQAATRAPEPEPEPEPAPAPAGRRRAAATPEPAEEPVQQEPQFTPRRRGAGAAPVEEPVQQEPVRRRRTS